MISVRGEGAVTISDVLFEGGLTFKTYLENGWRGSKS